MDFVFVLLINVVRIYKFAIIARILMSWVSPHPRSSMAVFLHRVTEPVLRVFRSFIPRMGMIDISPLIAFFALDFLQLGLISLMASV